MNPVRIRSLISMLPWLTVYGWVVYRYGSAPLLVPEALILTAGITLLFVYSLTGGLVSAPPSPEDPASSYLFAIRVIRGLSLSTVFLAVIGPAVKLVPGAAALSVQYVSVAALVWLVPLLSYAAAGLAATGTALPESSGHHGRYSLLLTGALTSSLSVLTVQPHPLRTYAVIVRKYLTAPPADSIALFRTVPIHVKAFVSTPLFAVWTGLILSTAVLCAAVGRTARNRHIRGWLDTAALAISLPSLAVMALATLYKAYGLPSGTFTAPVSSLLVMFGCQAAVTAAVLIAGRGDRSEITTSCLLPPVGKIQKLFLPMALTLLVMAMYPLRSVWPVLTVCIPAGAVLLLAAHRQVRLETLLSKRTAEFKKEKMHAEELLANILPQYVINELREQGTSPPREFKRVAVMFLDFAGFTALSSKLSAQKVISELNDIFTRFDAIVEQYDGERIKTIGDAYLAVCGMHTGEEDCEKRMVRIAQTILAYLKERNEKNPVAWEPRIGIHTGELMGGIVGTKKFIFDIFGDTVNIASRIESATSSMHINVSEDIYQVLKDDPAYQFYTRPAIEVKGKGRMNMYLLY